MTTARITAVCLTVWCVLYAWSVQAEPIPFTVLHTAARSRIDAPRQVAIRTAADWKSLWQEHDPTSPLPEIDFSRFMVVGVFLGTRQSGGYAVEIIRVEHSNGHVVVTYRERQPSPDGMVSMALTAPMQLVRLPRREWNVSFTRASVGGAR